MYGHSPVGISKNHSHQFQWALLAQLYHFVIYIMVTFLFRNKDRESLAEKVLCIALLREIKIPQDDE